jgi:phosphotransferase system HPr (HPr) family protein
MMVEQSVVIQNKSGLHARPASLLVKEASRFQCQLSLRKNDKEVDLKSILGLMSLAIMAGETVVIKAEGEDELQALTQLTSLIESGLGDS